MDTAVPTFEELAVAVVGLAILAVILGILVWAILQAAEHQPQAMLIIVLAVIATISILGYIVNEARIELITIAAAAVGALAGALTTLAKVEAKTNGITQMTDEKKEDTDGHRGD